MNAALNLPVSQAIGSVCKSDKFWKSLLKKRLTENSLSVCQETSVIRAVQRRQKTSLELCSGFP